jgi:hypothetical protein
MASTRNLDLGNTANWELIYSESKLLTDGLSQLQPFIVNILIEATIILVRVTSSSAKDTWLKAGWLYQYFNVPIIIGEQPLNYVGICNLQSGNVFFLEQVSSSYFLRFNSVPWLEDATVKVYQYIGDDTDEIEEKIDDITDIVIEIRDSVT